MQLQVASFDYYLDQGGDEGVDDNIMPIIQQMIDFIKNGIQRQSK